jgi:ParB family transcriptional regulator, chromosome partitioning protein
MSEERRLGRGLDSLLSASKPIQEIHESEPKGEMIYLTPRDIRENPYQPRTSLSDEALAELTSSIQANGILQPLVVRRVQHGYELVSGQRRLIAATRAGLPIVPAMVRQVDDSNMLTLALVENLQRADLNPIEKASAFRSLMERFSLTQDEVAKRIGIDRSSVANMIRLLDLPADIRDDVSRGTISMGHARALLSLTDAKLQHEMCERIRKHGLSVRAVEEAVAKKRADPKAPAPKLPHVLDLENRLRHRLAGKVEVFENGVKGRIVIHFNDLDELDRVLSIIGA